MLRQFDQPNGEELVFSKKGIELKFMRVKFFLIIVLDCRPCVHNLTIKNDKTLG